MTCDQAFDTAYDAGYFDKDEQGWVARPLRVTTRGDLVDVEDGGNRCTYRPGRRYPATGFVALDLVTGHHASWCLFDVESRRLVPSYSPLRSVMRTRPRPPGPLGERELQAALAACVAGSRLLLPDAPSPPAAPTLADVAALLARPDASLRLDVPGAYLLAWRRDGVVTGASARSASPVGEPYVAVSLGEQDRSINVSGGSLDELEPAFAAASAALGGWA